MADGVVSFVCLSANRIENACDGNHAESCARVNERINMDSV